MILQKLVGNIYSIFVEIALWLIPIAGFIALPFIIEGGFHFGFALLGLIAGLILDVILFGPIIIFFNMRASLGNLDNNLVLLGELLTNDSENSSDE